MTERFFAIVNPAAGGGRCGRRAAETLALLGDMIGGTEWTRGPQDARRIAAEAVGDGFTRLIAVGGDGTAFEVLNGALEAKTGSGSLTLSVLPLGTGNSLVRHFAPAGARLDEWAIQGLVEERRTGCDLLEVHHRTVRGEGRTYALGSVTFGLPTRVASVVNRRLKPLGVVGYSLAAVVELLRLQTETYDVRCEPAANVAPVSIMLCVQNTVTIGGNMRIAPGASPSDGLADLVWAEKASRFSMLLAFPRIFSGTHTSHPAFRQAQIEGLEFESPASREVMLDGEVQRLVVESVAVAPRALQLAL